MSLEKFRADLKYQSTDGGDYSVNFRNTPECDAPQTLINLIEHLCWMAVIAGKSDETREAIERGFASGSERRAELTKRNGLQPIELPEQICWWFHPDFKFIDPMADCHDERGYTPEEWTKIQDDGCIDITIDTSVSIEDIEQTLGRETDGEWDGWKPEPPTPDHFLIAAFDTENVECVLWWAKSRKSETTKEQDIV